MTTFTRRVAAALLTAGIATFAQAQAPVTPAAPAAPAAVAPPTTPAPVIPAEERPTGVAATVNGQVIPEVAVYRALRQFPKPEQEVARKEILSHLIDNIIVDQYLTALKITAEPAEVDKLIEELKAELKKTMKDYAAELNGMMLTETARVLDYLTAEFIKSSSALEGGFPARISSSGSMRPTPKR